MYKIELLGKHHNKANFDCGNEALNRYLHTMANQHAKKGVSRTHILTNADDEILGFYTLSAVSVDNPNIKGMPHSLPSVLLGRLAVSRFHQKQGHAQRLMVNAIERVIKASLDIGICFLVVDLKYQGLVAFYEQFGFELFDDNLRMYLKINDIA
ncbi:GNAT family N-acetyltransferase [Moraxella oblonga]|uniref:GNAT family N-acetyltransferase n=1 Tax=Moraxella oblonga TaxID=200413 RepID=UPI000837213C|nr:GNAT family N-acetyltransferase [Moraxella oblonga]